SFVSSVSIVLGQRSGSRTKVPYAARSITILWISTRTGCLDAGDEVPAQVKGCMLPAAPEHTAEAHMHRVGLVFALLVTLGAPLMAQAPTGTIAGTVNDQVGAVLPNAAVTVINKNTGASRVMRTAGDGTFSMPSLPAGAYD